MNTAEYSAQDLEAVANLHDHQQRRMSSLSAVYGIVARDLARTMRQKGRLVGGIARPFMWLLLVGTGFNTIARLGSGVSYQEFVYPGIIVMSALFGAMLMAISTVYDREFGVLRLMLASPAGTLAVLTGRVLAAAIVGFFQGTVVLAIAPFIFTVTTRQMLAAAGALALCALASSVMGLLVAARLRSVENFAGVINVILFPLLFLSGALYPSTGLPAGLRFLAELNPVTYQVDLMRHAFGHSQEFSAATDLLVLIGVTLVLFAAVGLLFDPEQRFIGRPTRSSPAS
jgi:ABC-2 type transport system permease protein